MLSIIYFTNPIIRDYIERSNRTKGYKFHMYLLKKTID